MRHRSLVYGQVQVRNPGALGDSVRQGHTGEAELPQIKNPGPRALSFSLARAGRLRGLTRIVSTRLCTLAGSSTDGSGRMSTAIGTLCTVAMQPEWMLPPWDPLGPCPSGAPGPAPALRSAPPARSPIPLPWWPAPPGLFTGPGCTIARPRGATTLLLPRPSGSAYAGILSTPAPLDRSPVSHADLAAHCPLWRSAAPSRCAQWTRPAADSG